MYSNQNLEKFQSILKREEVKKLRIMLISAIVSYPLWWLLARTIAPQSYDPLWQRLSLSFISLFLLLSTYFWDKAYIHSKKFYLIGWAYSYHLLFLYWKNADTAFYLISNLIQFPYLILAFPEKKQAQIYTYTKCVAAVLFALFVPHQLINPWLYAISIITVGHYSLTSLVQQFNILDNLKKVQGEFDLALSNMFEGIIITNREGTILSYNNIAEQIFQFQADSHIGKSLRETILFQNVVSENLLRYSEINHPLLVIQEETVSKKNIILGICFAKKVKFWLQFNIQTLSEMGTTDRILFSFSDITNLKKNQELKEQQHAQMAMNAKLASLFAVASGVAHEVNNPLGVIIGRLQIMEKKTEADDYQKEELLSVITKLKMNSQRIAKIVSNLLTLTKRADELPLSTVKLAQVLEDTLLFSREELKANSIELIIGTIPDVNIHCRPVQISQAFLNLLSNAKDAVLNQEEKWIRFSFKQFDENISILICDSGPEISSFVKDRMMEPFFTTKEVGKGAGLGLSVSKAIIEEHGGKLFLDTNETNTCINVQLNIEKTNDDKSI